MPLDTFGALAKIRGSLRVSGWPPAASWSQRQGARRFTGNILAIELSDTYFDRAPVANFDELVLHYPKSAFEPPFRSTIPLLCLIRDKTALAELTARCAMSSCAAFHLEFQEHPPLGSGKPSQTDLVIIGDNQSVSIDALWMEQRSERVTRWLGPRPTTNRRDVLAGWFNLLNKEAAVPLTPQLAGDVSYPLLSRSAAVCNSSAGRTLICYLRFASRRDEDRGLGQRLRADLAHLRDILGRPERLNFRLFEVDIEGTPAFRKLAELPRRSKKSALAVRDALVSETLFSFPAIRELDV